MSTLNWHKSSYSNGYGGECVEVADLASGARAVRDSKDPTGLALTFTPTEWVAFLLGVKAGEFN